MTLLIEADGSRQKALKVPNEREPVIPEFTDAVIVVAGLGGLGKSLNEDCVHRPQLFSTLSGLPLNEFNYTCCSYPRLDSSKWRTQKYSTSCTSNCISQPSQYTRIAIYRRKDVNGIA